MNANDFPSIEHLESRIAPAALFVSTTAAKYTDPDGDLVTVRFSKPILTVGNLADILTTTASGTGDVLTKINLAGRAAAAGTTITVSAAVAGNGDGLTTVGTIDATGIDLGAVTIKGDLATIIAGDSTTKTPGLKSLTVTSFGIAAALAGTTPEASTITGSSGALIVRTDFIGANFQVEAPTDADGKLASIFVGGSVRAGLVSFTGNIGAQGDIGTVKILGSVVGDKTSTGLIGSIAGKVGAVTIMGSLGGGEDDSGFLFGNSLTSLKINGDLQGGSGKNSGIVSFGTIGAVTILGSIFGAGGESSGQISSTTTIGVIKIGNYLQGGDGKDSGQIIAESGLGKVTISGSLIGGKGDSSGTVLSGGNIGAVKITGSLVGGGVDNTTQGSGQIWAFGGNIASVTIGGNATAGSGGFSGSILAEGKLGPVKIDGSIFSVGGADFVIRGKGAATGGNAIASLTVGGSVSNALILGGFGLSNEAQNANGSIGAVKVGGSWTAASIAAGVRNLGTDNALGGVGTAFDNFNFGDIHDSNYNSTTAVSKIASITIGGAIRGTTGGTDHYGFVAGQIGSLKIDGTTIPLSPGAATDNRLIGLTGDFRVHEV